MKQQDLNQLFDAARNVELETSVSEVTSWVGTAAASTTGVLGVVGKLKLLIVKKSIMLIGITSGTIGVVALSIGLTSSNSTSQDTPIMVSQLIDQEATSSSQHPASADANKTYQLPAIEPDVHEAPIAPEVERDAIAVEAPPSIEPIEIHVEPPLELKFEWEVPTSGPEIPEIDRTPAVTATHETRSSGRAKDVRGNGNVTSENRAISPFTSISISGIFDVEITQGSENTVIVETDSNLQEYVIVKNDGKELKLENKKANFKKIKKMKVHVTVKNLQEIYCNSVGDVHTTNTINSDNIKLNFNGVGDGSFMFNTDNLTVTSNAVGDVKLGGYAEQAEIETRAVGDIQAFNLVTKSMKIRHAAVGDAQVHVTKALVIDFTGVGDIIFKGDPSVIEFVRNKGVGRVKSK